MFKRLRGEKPTITYIDKSTTINIADGQAHKDTVRLYTDDGVRDACRRVVAPLDREGIDLLEVRRGPVVLDAIRKEHVPCFLPVDSTDTETNLIDHTRPAVLEIVRLAFKEGIKSRFWDGAVEFEAEIKDKGFMERVERGEPFRKGDSLRVRLHSRTWRTEKGRLVSESTIPEVIEHVERRSPEQLSLD
ncbi:MAG TPA: hypothetical protein VLE22_16540 [Bryobacteraceae bacterium]|nr:hypothetical protein [Bryobacteraceae bacterium]